MDDEVLKMRLKVILKELQQIKRGILLTNANDTIFPSNVLVPCFTRVSPHDDSAS